MSAFPEFDLSAILGDDASDLREDNRVIDGLNDDLPSAPITTPPPANLNVSNNSSPSKSRKRLRKNVRQHDSLLGDMESLMDSVVNSVASDFQIGADVEISTNNGDFGADPDLGIRNGSSPSPNQLTVADEYLNTEDGNNEGETSAGPIDNAPPASPDGITNEDPASARCATCDVNFSTKRQRCEHLRDVHGVEKPFKCEHCRARFPYSSSLYNHARIHSDNRPFKCNLCDSSFRWKNSLRHHRLHTHKEDPESVHIASKCVWEGKKPAPPDMPLPIPIAGPTDASTAPSNQDAQASPPKKPRAKRTRSSSKRSNNANGTLSPPFEIDVAKLLEEAEKAFANSFTTENPTASGSCGGATSTSFNATSATPAAVAPKRKRKPKATFRRNAVAEALSSSGAAGKGHTCGHCEKEFTIWSDLVSHIKDCATLNDDGAGASWMPADEVQEGGDDNADNANESFAESDGETNAQRSLVIDPMGHGGIRQDSYEEEEEEVIDASTNYNSDSMGGISRAVHYEEADLGGGHSENQSDAGDGESEMESRICDLEKRLGEATRTYEARIHTLETTVSRLKSQLANHDQAQAE